MRLSKIKLVGFKSFVDPTTITFPSNLMGIVGPNGCGKSNVIDAVRWVMGEISASKLRGDSMADVIFNGSSARKPSGQAAVELVFDNAEGKLGGQYASYAEIALKRVVSRDGTSAYFLNNVRCRRRDITDLFLGTGLGSRSYSIIEQGMVSRLIEARPEDLRMFLEEAAGISKYKERRRETENRIGHTRENLERLNDLRAEIEKQLDVLKRQARTAERFNELKAEERTVKAELLALRWRELDSEVAKQDKVIHDQEVAVEAALAEQRAVEARIEHARVEHVDASDTLGKVQSRFYEVGAEIQRLEQAILHARELKARQERDLAQAELAARELGEHIARDRSQLDTITAELAQFEPELASTRDTERASQAALAEAEQRMQAWQQGWDEFVREANEAAQAAQVQRTQIDYLERNLAQGQTRHERLTDEGRGLEAARDPQGALFIDRELADAATRRDALQKDLEGVHGDIARHRQEDQQLTAQLHELRRSLETLTGRLASLEALQQSALGRNRAAVTDWLKRAGLDSLPRLAEKLSVERGWERAVETVLGFHLEAVCVEQLDGFDFAGFTQGSVTLVEAGRGAGTGAGPAPSLADKLSGAPGLAALVAGVFVAEDLNAARALRSRLAPGQSVVTRDGTWVGPNWVRVTREDDAHAGVLAREQEIKQAKTESQSLNARNAELASAQERGRAALRELEGKRERLQGEVNQAHRKHAELSAQADARRLRLEQVEQRLKVIATELAELEQQRVSAEAELSKGRLNLEQKLERGAVLDAQRATLMGERDTLRAALDAARAQANADRERAHQIALKVESRRSVTNSLGTSLARATSQLTQAETRRTELAQALEQGVAPFAAQQQELSEVLVRRTAVEEELGSARRAVEALDESLRVLDEERHTHEQRVNERREAVGALRLQAQEARVRRETTREQLAEHAFELEAVFAAMPQDATVAVWDERHLQLEQKILRLGAVNLAAIEQYQEQSERKQYLDMQHADLTEALTTLENAIRKIDRETRTRFKETFDRVNATLQKAFPRLFGGGHAYLEMTGEDLLDAGVAVMARPPGKRNSTIHLLSGGEKALTAIALVFAIFELNPAPFCMLDEVDAPLDDVNAGRFCDLVREMSDRTQFVFITHNKITMELSRQLTGVTMNEPGVSRLVAVDVDEAVRLAAV
jgi:chromosome segregation protein